MPEDRRLSQEFGAPVVAYAETNQLVDQQRLRRDHPQPTGEQVDHLPGSLPGPRAFDARDVRVVGQFQQDLDTDRHARSSRQIIGVNRVSSHRQ